MDKISTITSSGECEACGATGETLCRRANAWVCADMMSCNARVLDQAVVNSPEECEALTGAGSIMDTYDPWD